MLWILSYQKLASLWRTPDEAIALAAFYGHRLTPFTPAPARRNPVGYGADMVAN